MSPPLSAPLVLHAHLAPRVWGGTRLAQGDTTPTGEAWVVYEGNRVVEGPHAGRTLGELSAEHAPDLLGSHATGARFPLLIKLLDCAEWLSLQVHPNDEQARELAGEEHLGKTEAWFILDAAPGAELIAGVRPDTDPGTLRAAILEGRAIEHAERHPVAAGDTVLMPAGTLHALGPGLFLYEVQQTSDVTYRVYDWDRPASAGRALHLCESALVTTATRAAPVAAPPPHPGEVRELTRCPYFVLERLIGGAVLEGDTGGESFHALTVLEGSAHLIHAGGETVIGPLTSVVLPAALGPYRLEGEFRALRARLP